MGKAIKFESIFVLLLATVLFSQCSLDANCYQQMEVPVIRFEMPDSIPLDSTATIQVVYVTYGPCSILNDLKVYQLADTLSIHVMADYDGCDCPGVIPDSVVTYQFVPTAARNYIFRAWKYNNTILQDTLLVYAN
ncbi:MAG: hypothetical protein CVU09_14600 [Bacteroidetes bacterium HGW-Bacteroidetes-4]|jgi:hypothetical protein|nr:MAG: hypothetical protein CVU09_14600 [Bacteroidetes bacterium HGW-Bacteroidetes-4]